MKTAYLRFCLHFGLTPMPANRATVILYTVFLARSLNPRSIPGYLNIIRLMHLGAGLPNNPLGDWELKMIQKGIARRLGTPPKQKLPITPVLLLQIRGHLNPRDSLDCTFWCACLLAFYSFLRKSSLLPQKASQHDQTALQRQDLVLDEPTCMLFLTVRHTKTLQLGQRTLRIPIAGQPGSHLCPLLATKAMLAFLPSDLPSANCPLFSYMDKSGALTSLDYAHFTKKLKQVLSQAGVPPSNYSGHSFRRGGCSFAFQVGIPPLLIKLRGDWRSNAYERYVFISDTMHVKVAKALSLAARSS